MNILPMNSKIKSCTILLIFVFLFIHVHSVNAVDPEYTDSWSLYPGTSFDQITWIDPNFPPTFSITMGLTDPGFTPVKAYCVNKDRNIDSVYEFCMVEDSVSRDVCGGVTEVYPIIDSSGSDPWYDSSNVDPYVDVGSGGNTFYNGSKQDKRGQVQYYGVDENLYYQVDEDTGGGSVGYSSGLFQLADNFSTNSDNILGVDVNVYTVGTPGDDLTIALRSTLLGSDIVSGDIASGDVTSSPTWISVDFGLTSVTASSEHWIVASCNGCDSSNYYKWSIGDVTDGDCEAYAKWSNDGGVSFSNAGGCLSLKVYNATCSSKGSSSNSAVYDYYFVDKTENQCDVDGNETYNIVGYYGVASTVLINTDECASYMVCDADHDNQQSTDNASLPTSPCKIQTGAPLGCASSSECWNDAVCSGARFDYSGFCTGDDVDILTEEYDDGCGGTGVLVTQSPDYGNSCEIDGGFPSGYVCDSNFENNTKSTENAVYNEICKGWVGNSCTLDADCHHSLSCESGFCGYDMLAIFTHNLSETNLYEGQSVLFDNSLSTSSDSNIQYACWQVDSVNTECDGNSTQCSSQCSGASFDSTSWDDGFINTFSSEGSVVINLVSGSQGLYSDSDSETFCVSGSTHFCWTCSDNLQNDDETDIDWGGHCGSPYFIKCTNGILDNVTNESSIDYGGVCGQCDNSSVTTDEDLIFLKDTNTIVYPFDTAQCIEPIEIKGGVTVFLLIISSILIVPIAFVIIILVTLLIILLFGGFGLIGTIASRRNILKKKDQKKPKK